MCTYNTISSHTDHFEIQKKKRNSEERLSTFVNQKCLLIYSQCIPLKTSEISKRLIGRDDPQTSVDRFGYAVARF